MSAIKNLIKLHGGHLKHRDAIKLSIITFLILLCMVMAYYAHFILYKDIVFTHFFYVPIILAGIWWGRHAIWVGVFLGLWLIVTDTFSSMGVPSTLNILRAGMFIVISTVVGVLREQSMKTERRLRETQGQILENTGGGIWIIDKDFNVIWANITLARMAGLRKKDLLGMKCYEAFKGELCHTENCMLNRILLGENHIECEVEEERVDGSKISCLVISRAYLNPEGEIIGIIEDLRDIDQLKQLNKELEEEKVFAENIIANFLDTLIVTNPDGTIRTINQTTLDLLEYKEDELIGKPVGMIFAEEEEEEEEEVKPFFTGALEELSKKGVMQNHELTYVTKSGRRIPMSFNASIMRDEKGNIIGLVAGAKDISKIKETEAQLRQAQKMEAVGQLAGGVAHDFNNILTAIQGYTDLALMSEKEADRLYSYLNEIRKVSANAANLTRKLLLFGRRQPMEMIPLDLNRVIHDVGNLLNRLIGEDIFLSTDLVPGLWTIKGDSGAMEQVIMNLVVNARDAMPDGGRITIKTENVVIDEEYTKIYRYARSGKFVCLSIQDTGVGMDQVIIDRIFEPFFTTKGPGKGSGMGLSVVYGIVKEHKGWINVESSPGKGATFRVYLPAVSMEPWEKQEAPISLQELRGKGERILLVEDDKYVRELTERMLSANGYKVYAAANAQEAMAIFKEEDGNFALIFCDVILPDGRGPELAKQFHRIKPGISILFASGYSDEKSDWRAIREGGYLYLQKPYSLSDLLKSIKQSLKKD